MVFLYFKQKTAYKISECDWIADVCSSDLCDKIANADTNDIEGLAWTVRILENIDINDDKQDRKSVV